MASSEELNSKINKLEKQVSSILENSKNDLEMAKKLQKTLIPNRTRNIAGIETLARYYSAGQLNADSFDILSSQNSRFLWAFHIWTGSFGLSTMFMQAMVQAQASAFTEENQSLEVKDFFNLIVKTFSESTKPHPYRLRVIKMDTGTLKTQALSYGFAPLLKRTPSPAGYGQWQVLGTDSFKSQHMMNAVSSETIDYKEAHFSDFVIEPGSRLFSISPTWNREVSEWKDHYAPLKVAQGDEGARSDTDLKDDLNHLLYNAEEYTKKCKEPQDLSVLAFEVDKKKLHLA